MKPTDKTIDLTQLFLGPLDADDDAHLEEYFVSFGDFPDLLGKSRFVIVGAKGTGKSAIRRHVSNLRRSQGHPVIDINDEYGFSLSELQATSPAEIKNKMKAFLVAAIIQHILTSSDIAESNKARIRKLGKDAPLIEKLLKPLKLKAWVVEYAIGELFSKGNQSKMASVLDGTLTASIAAALDAQDLWIVIDDIDSVFTSDDKASSLKFIEGLIYAASDLGFRVFKKKVWTIVFLKSEIYEELTRKATEFDKELRYVWEIAWSVDSLVKFLAERIRWAFGAHKGLPPAAYWKLLFDSRGDSELEKIQKQLIERSINGPRDLLLLVDLSRQTAASQGAAKIMLSHVEESEYDYGKKKLRQITSNFQRIYEDIDRVVDRLFREGKQSYMRKELEKHINDNLLTNPQAREDFKDLTWVRRCSAYLFTEILYRIGFIGYWSSADQRFIYVLENANPDKTLTANAEFKIHSAFTKYLELGR